MLLSLGSLDEKRQTICSRVILIAACALLAGAFNAQVLRTGHPETYVVQRGDTLWDISARFLEDPWLWPEIGTSMNKWPIRI